MVTRAKNNEKEINMKALILMALTFCTFATLKAETISAKGKFVSDKSDRLSFVKEQLLHSAFLDAVSKSMQQLGLDGDLFWKNYNENLKRRVDAFEQNMISKYEQDKKDLNSVKDEMRYRKLNAIKKFGKVDSLIQSYSIKSMTRSSSNPNYRFISIDAKINKDNLAKLYYRYTSNKSSALIDSLLINIDFNNRLFNFAEIGVDRDTDFTSVIEDNWKTWFTENKPANIKNVDVLKESEAEEVEKVAGESKDFPAKYENSLYLKIIVNMKKVASSSDLKSFSFYFQVSGFLMDIKTNRILKSFNVEDNNKDYTNINMENFSSVLANYIYRMPMTEFKYASDKLKNLRPIENKYFINVINYKNLSQINDLRSTIEQRGIKYSLSSTLDKVSSNFVSLSTLSSASISELVTMTKEIFGGKKGSNVQIIESSTGLSIKFN